jgi:hypothetical protein
MEYAYMHATINNNILACVSSLNPKAVMLSLISHQQSTLQWNDAIAASLIHVIVVGVVVQQQQQQVLVLARWLGK